MQNLDLRPNCLITPSELIFVPGARSLFFYKNPFGLLPRFLYEHGYRVQVLPLPFRRPKLRKMAFENWLSIHPNQSFHFFLDEITADEFASLLDHSQIKTLTILTTEKSTHVRSTREHKTFLFALPKTHEPIPLTYKFHKLFNLFYKTKTNAYETTFSPFNRIEYDRFLDHCVKLAEDELYA